MSRPAFRILANLLSAFALVGAQAHGSEFAREALPFLKQHCIECHDADTKKGGLDLEALKPDFAEPQIFAKWERVFDKIERGEMPPKKKPRPTEAEQKPAMAALRACLHEASAARQAHEGRVVFRRLNRVEYENTIHDLLAIDTPLKETLPEDASAQGFDNIGAALDTSSVLMERYLEAADMAIDAAIAAGPQPVAVKKRYELLNQIDANHQLNSLTILRLADGLVMFGSHYMPTAIKEFSAPAPGRYHVRLSACAYQSQTPMVMAVTAGDLIAGRGEKHTVDYYYVSPGAPQVFEFTDTLHRGDTFKAAPDRLEAGEGDARRAGSANYKGPGLAVQWMEIEGPLSFEWPPESRRRLFGDLPLVPADATSEKNLVRAEAEPSKARYLLSQIKWAIKSEQPGADAECLLRSFATRAFRRPVTNEELAPLLAMVNDHLKAGETFDEALRVGFKGVLTAPEFLFLRCQPGRLDGYALASRLSYFLWSAPPDEELLALAAKGTLTQPAVLRAQTERLLKSPKAATFTHNFLGQWLDLRLMDFTTPDKKLYPEYDELLSRGMVSETYGFFQELLTNDSSVRHFIDSDFSILNQRMAEHYGIGGVTGMEFRKVALPASAHRGGVMTQASVLKVTANGTTTSPVLRGKWIMDRILGIPPDPPPKSVPAIEPDIRGARTIREQLDAHRHEETCATCHSKIDPPGFALENFDVIGGWRERYRILPPQGTRTDKMRLHVADRDLDIALGGKVDASSALPDGTAFADVTEFKKLLLRDPTQIARCVTAKLLTYATGAPIQFADRAVIDAILSRTRAKDYGLRSIVHEVVQSPAFLNK